MSNTSREELFSILACARTGDVARLKALLRLSGGAELSLDQEPWSAQQGADAADWLGRTALSRASRYNRAEAIRLLMHAGAKVNVVDVYGQSPLHVAAHRGHCEALVALLGLGGGDARIGYDLTTERDHSNFLIVLAAGCLPDRRFGLTPLEHFISALNAARGSSSSACVTSEKASTISAQEKQIIISLIAIDMLQVFHPLRASARGPSTTFKLRPYCYRLRLQPSFSSSPASHPRLTYAPGDHALYCARGFHIFTHFLSPQLLSHARARATCITTSLHRQADPLRLYNLHQCGEQWILRLASSPAVKQIVSYHCGHSFYFYISHLIAKPPHSRYAIPWHQDYRTKGSARHCSIWIALDDVDAKNGGVRCVPGAHKYDACQLRVHDIGATDFTSVIHKDSVSYMKHDLHKAKTIKSPGSEIVLQLNAGQASMLHPLMPHYSPRNDTDRWRRGLLLRFSACSEHVAQSCPLDVSRRKGRSGGGRGQRQESPLCPPDIFKDGSYFVDFRSGELFEACSIKMGAH